MKLGKYDIFGEFLKQSESQFPVSTKRHQDGINTEIWFFDYHIVISNMQKHNENISSRNRPK